MSARRVEIGPHVYEHDGQDWTCPSGTHDAQANFDLLLDEIERLRWLCSALERGTAITDGDSHLTPGVRS